MTAIQKPLDYELSASEAARQIKNGSLKATDLVRACLEQIERWDEGIRSWTHLDPERALATAEEVDLRVQRGQATGALAGVPIGIKDIFNTADMPTQMGSPIWAGFTPGNDARVVHYMRMSGAVLLGKTVTAEFAVHAPGATQNPHRPGYIPGTSSSGSAAAVAAYMVPAALGTQTAGSIIRPASYCGVYGFKPSFGLVPRTAMLKTTDSLDTVGWFARSIDDLELLFDVCRVKGADFPLSHTALTDVGRQTKRGGADWKVAFLRGPQWSGAESETRTALENWAESLNQVAGVSVEAIEYPTEIDEAHSIHSLIYDRALAYYFKEEFQNHTLVSRQIYDIVERGNRITLDQYSTALKQQSTVAKAMDEFFINGYDIVLDMATAGEALKGLHSIDRPDHALIWTLAGLPSVSVPVLRGRTGLPLGAQLVARRYNDILLLNFLKHLENHGLLPARTYPEPPVAGVRKAC